MKLATFLPPFAASNEMPSAFGFPNELREIHEKSFNINTIN
jgi:hypothetical protein